MIYGIIIFIIVLILLIGFHFFYKNFLIKKVLNRINNRLKTNYQTTEVTKMNKNIYEIKTPKKNYLFFIENIPTNTTIQINNAVTWELKMSNSAHDGAMNNNSKYLSSVIKFMNIETDSQKIIVFSPDPKKIVMYINECEIILVSSKTNVYGTNIIKQDEIDRLK